MVQIAIVDDHPLIVEGLKNILANTENINILFTANSSKELFQILQNVQPQLLILDINLPDGNGIEICSILKNQYPSIKIILFTSLREASMIKQSITNKADGFLFKNADPNELIDAIETVNNGKRYLQNEVLEMLSTESYSTPNQAIPYLTRREKEILSLISNEFTTQQIADKLFISVNTVETHRNNLFQKLGAKNAVGLVRIAIQKGLIN